MPRLFVSQKKAPQRELEGCQLVVLSTDASDDAAASARQLLSDADASCLNLRCTEAIAEDISLTSWPNTCFADREGELLAAPFEGTSPENYRAILADGLAQLEYQTK